MRASCSCSPVHHNRVPAWLERRRNEPRLCCTLQGNIPCLAAPLDATFGGTSVTITTTAARQSIVLFETCYQYHNSDTYCWSNSYYNDAGLSRAWYECVPDGKGWHTDDPQIRESRNPSLFVRTAVSRHVLRELKNLYTYILYGKHDDSNCVCEWRGKHRHKGAGRTN